MNINAVIKKVLKSDNFSEIIEFITKNYPKRIFLIQDKITLSFEEFNFKINQACNFLKKNKIKNNSVVTLYLHNSIEFIILYFACIRFGAIVSPIPFGLSNDQIKYYLKVSKSNLLISNQRLKLKTSQIIFKDYENFDLNLKKFEKIFISNKIKKNKICVYYFSSGTTDKPKLIKYSNFAMVSCQKLLFKSNFLEPFSNHMCILPLGHTASLRYTIKQAIIGVGKVYLYKNFWTIKDIFWKEIVKKKINFIGVVPSIIQTIFYLYKNKKIMNNYIKFFGCGSSILSKELQEDFKKKFNIILKNIYGMSEIGIATMDNLAKKNLYGSIGKPLNGVKIKLLGPNNKFVKKENIVGEICVKTPAIFSGYIGVKKINNNKLYYKNYFRTGDLAVFKNGSIFFTDRSKDIVIKGGVNISPHEVDSCLQKNPKIFEAATIGIKSDFYGETLKSFIVLKKNKKITVLELKNYCNKRLGNIRTPEIFEFVNKFPKTASGKILKRKLK